MSQLADPGCGGARTHTSSHRHHPNSPLHPLPRRLTSRGPTRRRGVFADAWGRLDRVQELGGDGEGHAGCVNALSWSDDGATLLSGSDDKRICIWTADTRPTAPTAELSPHPLKLSGTIITGHRANIFSARFLPNSGTPTIVSCAGDGDIRVFDVERLQPAAGMDLRVRRARGALWGVEGPGVRVLRCHKDRTKRIATEGSPFLFLTVSEDGTVRQHDLRRPHTCRDECPQPLFQAPVTVDLYSLSVSPLTPHLFAVAGQTDCAYICDRRKPEHQTPSWGRHTRRAEQVTCVRRLALPESEWESVERRTVYRERHITCVKMSADNAGEVICAFARHSTSLFSLNDSPAESSARVRHGSVVPPNPESNTRRAERGNRGDGEEPVSPVQRRTKEAQEARPPSFPSPPTAPPGPSKRRISSVSRPESRPGGNTRQRTDSSEPREETGPSVAARAAQFLRSPPGSPPPGDEPDAGNSTAQPRRDRRPLGSEWEDGPDEVLDLAQFARDHATGTDAEANLNNVDEEEDMDLDGDDTDESERDEEDNSDDDSDDDFRAFRSSALSSDGEFKGVEVLYPRKSYRGARNVETVKDCNFLGDASDKVASGSDDGNWFVWDKETGRLDGIWWGDSDIVNVMEQHPTLPVVAVSGIDNTVKMFAPVTRPPVPTFNRTPEADRIVERNLSRAARPSSMIADPSAIQLLATMLRNHPQSASGSSNILDLFRSIGIVRIIGEDDDDDDDDEDDEEGGGGSRALVPRRRSQEQDEHGDATDEEE